MQQAIAVNAQLKILPLQVVQPVAKEATAHVNHVIVHVHVHLIVLAHVVANQKKPKNLLNTQRR